MISVPWAEPRVDPVSGHSDSAPAKQPSLFPALPAGGYSGRSKQHGRALAIERAAMRHTVQTKAYVAEPPASAPRYQKPGASHPDLSTKAQRLLSDVEPADFFPWTGHSPEDTLNELTTRNGFYDKLPASQNESLTARPSILSSLKNKSGLQILSSVFASALDQRQIHGNIKIGSTFKPPPRVTLTDTKKESWLRDLANPAIPLRRLSRTIPHGIRGKILLDHCLNKVIPISRAIWLVKCVGANEIRACKRKGTSGVFAVGGEAKWIQDWTSAVEQHLETIIDSCGSDQWESKLKYSLRLISNIYDEGLLDHDQYLRWLIRHLATCDLDSIPIWLLIVNAHKPDLLRCRQYGMHLVEALLPQIKTALQPAHVAIYDFVFQELANECKALLISNPDCFLIPQTWKAYKEIVQNSVVGKDSFLQTRFREICMRNQRLDDRAAAQETKTYSSAEQTVVAALDSLASHQDYPNVSRACRRAGLTPQLLVDVCIEWASSTYRYGSFRVYAVVRLLRMWSRRFLDLQGSVCNFLARSENLSDIDKTQIYKLCAELVSSKHLSVGKYLQWLMASGALHTRGDGSSGDPDNVRLLYEMPLHDLPNHTLNLRRSLLASLGTTVELENETINVAKAQIVDQLPRLFPVDGGRNKQDQHRTLSSLSWTVKSELAWFIRHAIAPHSRENVQQDESSTQEIASRLTKEDFSTLRNIFEDLQEYGIFTDVLIKLVKATKNEGLLADITDTVNYHFEIFHALGVARKLFDALFSQRKLILSQDDTRPAVTHGLTDLATRLPDTGLELRRLRKDEISLDPKQSAAAPSPISDNVVEAVQSDNPTFFEEMDQILMNGTSIDQPTLTRCFGAITSHLEMSWNEAIAFPCRYPELLARLRALDPKNFDLLAATWLDSLALQKSRPHLSIIIVPLVCLKVFTLATIVDHACRLNQEVDLEQSNHVALEVLELLSTVQSRHMPSVEYRVYRFLDQQQSILKTHNESLIFLLSRCILEASVNNGSLRTQAKATLTDDNVQSFIRMIIAHASTTTEKPRPAQDATFRSALRDLLSQEDSAEPKTLGPSGIFSRLLDNVSVFNRALSRFKLQVIVESTSETEHDTANVLTEVLMAKLESAPESKVALWSYLISSLPANTTLVIHQRAAEAILSRIDSGYDDPSTNDQPMTDRLVDIMLATANSIPDPVALSLLEAISERLHTLLKSPALIADREGATDEPDHSIKAVDTLLRLLTIHQATILNPAKFPHSTLSRISLCLASLYINLASSPEQHRSVSTHILDVLSILSDTFTSQTRSRCIDALSTSSSSSSGGGGALHQYPRLAFIFNDANAFLSSDVEWLQLVTPAAAAATSAASHTAGASKNTTTTSTELQPQPYSLRKWELVQDATPVMTENDTGVSLTLFGARRSVLS